MKKSKILLILFILITSTIHIKAQENTATKEETMEWLANKFEEVLVAPRTFHSYKNGIFAYNRNPEEGKNYTVYLNLNKVTNGSAGCSLVITCPGGDTVVNKMCLIGKGILTYSNGRQPENEFNSREYDSEIGCFRGIIDILDIKSVDGLNERIANALKHLIKLNVSKKENEKF